MPTARETSGQASATPGLASKPILRWRGVFRGAEAEVRRARHWVASLLPACEARDDLVLVAGELSANAVRHTASGRGGFFIVEVTWHGAVVRVAVADCGAPTGPRIIADPLAEQGRGLRIVQELCSGSGVSGDHRGRLVWGDVPWTGPEPASAAGAGLAAGDQAATIRDGLACLARRHDAVPTWFGCSTRQWWALAGRPGARRLVTAPTPDALASLLDTIQATRPASPEPAPDTQAARPASSEPAPDTAAARPGQRNRPGHATGPSRLHPPRPVIRRPGLLGC